MLDIIFISYDEPQADKNWAYLKKHFPHAKRVHGVKGIAEAHLAASKKADTSFFYVVDADAEILPTFDFSFKPSEHDSDWVHVWYADNPALGTAYGYGGVKLFAKKHFRKITSWLDFTTTLTGGVKIHHEVACITRFNTDPYRAFRGAFRESVKLFTTAHDTTKSDEVRREAAERLEMWESVDHHVDFGSYIKAGVKWGLNEAALRGKNDLQFINDHDLIKTLLTDFDSGVDLNFSPILQREHPMAIEFTFTTRIAGILYDPYVAENLKLEEVRDALSDGQLYSKIWLVDQLEPLLKEYSLDRPAKVAVLGGWIGLLSLMMFCRELPVNVVSIDIDARANVIAEKVNWDKQFKALTADMYGVDYSQYDVIINTSSEHIDSISGWRKALPKGKLVIVQNNDFEDGEGHISTVPNSSRLRNLIDLTDVSYEGTRKFAQYDRFMIIGTT